MPPPSQRMSAWTRQWPEGPPDDWDDIRDRLRTMPFGRTGARQSRLERLRRPKTADRAPVWDLNAGPQPATWRPAPIGDPEHDPQIAESPRTAFDRYWSPRWWGEVSGVTTQTLLLIIGIVLVLLIAAGFVLR